MAKCEREKEGTTLSATLVGQLLNFIKKCTIKLSIFIIKSGKRISSIE